MPSYTRIQSKSKRQNETCSTPSITEHFTRSFLDTYAGYRPNIVEIPNGDGKADAEKRYAHVATKYMKTDEERSALMRYLEIAHAKALEVAKYIKIPPAFTPDIRYGALRILEYPPGSTSNLHEDFDLFTLMGYRDQPEKFKVHDGTPASEIMSKMHRLNRQAHMGQIGTEIGLGPATPHSVLPSEKAQHSIVYFAIPNHDAVLPNGIKVGTWIEERIARSRISANSY